MKFTPELPFAAGRLRPLQHEDVDILFQLYSKPEIPGQKPPAAIESMAKLVDYSVQMAATQRGMMWLVEVDGQVQGIVSAFDWQPSWLRLMLRVDGLPSLALAQRQAALQTAMDFLGSKYHIFNFAYQWIAGQNPEIKTMLHQLGFSLRATLRDGWRVGEGFADVEQYHFVLDKQKPKAGRLGEFDNPAQDLNKSVGGRV